MQNLSKNVAATVSVVAIAAIVVLFASGPLVGNQLAQAYKHKDNHHNCDGHDHHHKCNHHHHKKHHHHHQKYHHHHKRHDHKGHY